MTSYRSLLQKKITKYIYLAAVLWIRDVYPGSEFFHPGSKVKKISNPGSASKN
jgi:hypothetical protein